MTQHTKGEVVSFKMTRGPNGGVNLDPVYAIMQHTKGDWTNNGEGIIVSQKGDICTMASVASDHEEMEANAALIAAAPKLLRFAEMVAGTHSPWASAAKDAIAAAKVKP